MFHVSYVLRYNEMVMYLLFVVLFSGCFCISTGIEFCGNVKKSLYCFVVVFNS